MRASTFWLTSLVRPSTLTSPLSAIVVKRWVKFTAMNEAKATTKASRITHWTVMRRSIF